MKQLGRHALGLATTLALVALLSHSGCSRDARLAGKKLREVKVQTVTDQGLTLGPLAAEADNAQVEESVKQVTFVLLKAIRDDVKAGGDVAAREAALDRQFAVAAPHRIYDSHARGLFRVVDTRDEAVHQTVQMWAPTLAYYAGEFDFDWPTASQRMQVAVTGKSDAKSEAPGRAVYLPLRDPNHPDDPARHARIELTRENGYWRVWWITFSARPAPRLTQATTQATATQ